MKPVIRIALLVMSVMAVVAIGGQARAQWGHEPVLFDDNPEGPQQGWLTSGNKTVCIGPCPAGAHCCPNSSGLEEFTPG